MFHCFFDFDHSLLLQWKSASKDLRVRRVPGTSGCHFATTSLLAKLPSPVTRGDAVGKLATRFLENWHLLAPTRFRPSQLGSIIKVLEFCWNTMFSDFSITFWLFNCCMYWVILWLGPIYQSWRHVFQKLQKIAKGPSSRLTVPLRRRRRELCLLRFLRARPPKLKVWWKPFWTVRQIWNQKNTTLL